jgi:predicted ATPase
LNLLKAGTDPDWLRDFIIRKGQASSLLHFGPKVTSDVSLELTYETAAGERVYRQRLLYGAPDSLVPGEHEVRFAGRSVGCLGYRRPAGFVRSLDDLRLPEGRVREDPGHPSREAAPSTDERARLCDEAFAFVGSLSVFQFDDTTAEARIRRAGYVEDNRSLHSDGGNLAAFLRAMKRTRPDHYRRIVGTIRQLAPFFDDFDLAARSESPRDILLNWRERGSEVTFGPHQLSDGTLRTMALVSLLLQPEPPDVVIVDEPELGLHPYAINVLASLVRELSTQRQVILATQSALLVDQFEPADIVVAERKGPESVFRRLDEAKLEDWLKEYSLSELWEKNVLGGVPGA